MMRQTRSGLASSGVFSDKTRCLYKDLRKQNTAASCSFMIRRFLFLDLHFICAFKERVLKCRKVTTMQIETFTYI